MFYGRLLCYQTLGYKRRHPKAQQIALFLQKKLLPVLKGQGQALSVGFIWRWMNYCCISQQTQELWFLNHNDIWFPLYWWLEVQKFISDIVFAWVSENQFLFVQVCHAEKVERDFSLQEIFEDCFSTDNNHLFIAFKRLIVRHRAPETVSAQNHGINNVLVCQNV